LKLFEPNKIDKQILLNASAKLDASFYNRPNVLQIAKELIGKILVTNFERSLLLHESLKPKPTMALPIKLLMLITIAELKEQKLCLGMRALRMCICVMVSIIYLMS
jgi:hypothetical protein